MAFYTHGNLAVQEHWEPQHTHVKQDRKKSKSSITIGEKLLYLFSILLCISVAGAILWQYTQIYSINTRIQQVNLEIEKLEKENLMLKLEAQQLQEPKRLLELGKALGFVPAAEGSAVTVSANSHYLVESGKKIAYSE